MSREGSRSGRILIYLLGACTLLVLLGLVLAHYEFDRTGVKIVGAVLSVLIGSTLISRKPQRNSRVSLQAAREARDGETEPSPPDFSCWVALAEQLELRHRYEPRPRLDGDLDGVTVRAEVLAGGATRARALLASPLRARLTAQSGGPQGPRAASLDAGLTRAFQDSPASTWLSALDAVDLRAEDKVVNARVPHTVMETDQLRGLLELVRCTAQALCGPGSR